jgi:hypothetical protein
VNLEHATPELFAALALAQSEVENASKNAANPHFKSKYADLAEVLNTVRPVFSRHGLSVLQSTEFDTGIVSVTTAISHASGGYVTSRASCVPAKSDAQGVGSATTYLRRYSLAAMAGVAQEDDDGNAAAHNRPARPVAQAVNPTPITTDQAAELADLMRSTHTVAVDFLRWLNAGVDSIADLPSVHYKRAKAALESKAAKLAKESSNAVAA